MIFVISASYAEGHPPVVSWESLTERVEDFVGPPGPLRDEQVAGNVLSFPGDVAGRFPARFISISGPFAAVW